MGQGNAEESNEPADREVASGVLSLDHQLAQLREGYAERLPGRLATLCEALNAARHAEAKQEGEPRDRALRLVHQLRGSAGSHGYSALSAAMGRIEDLLRACGPIRDLASEDWEQLLELVQGVDVRASEPPPRTAHASAANWKAQGSFPPDSSAWLAHILVVDDDSDIRQEVEIYGRAAAFEVTGVSNSRQAVEACLKRPVDLALVDLHLEEGDSAAEVVRCLRAVPGQTRLPVIGFSADDSVANRLAACAAGASLFLKKPIAVDELAVSVRSQLEQRFVNRGRLLIVDGNAQFARLLSRRLIARGWDAHTLGDYEQIFPALAEVQPDLLLLDVNLEVSGYELCKVIRANPNWRELPIVFLAEASSPGVLVACYEAGADDFLARPVNEAELEARMALRIERSRQFRRLAHEDPLTGLLTRRAFSDTLDQRLADCERHGRSLCLALIDVDFFKKVNDTHGHVAGDRVLRRLGHLLQTELRTEDPRARWGGEEFIVALPETELAAGACVLERILRIFSACQFEADQGVTFQCSFSAGMVAFPHEAATAAALVEKGDERLYLAKESGRARVVWRQSSEELPRSA